MAERLTERFNGVLVKKGNVSRVQVFTKLGKLEDILEKYGIESVEELGKKLADGIIWERACELACDVLRDINYKIYNEDRIDFENSFYRQAKKEKENE